MLCFLSRFVSSVLWAGVSLLSGVPQGFEDRMYIEPVTEGGGCVLKYMQYFNRDPRGWGRPAPSVLRLTLVGTTERRSSAP